MATMHRIFIAALFLVTALCGNAQGTQSPRICLPSDLDPELHFYHAVGMVKSDMKVSDICDDSFVNAALAS